MPADASQILTGKSIKPDHLIAIARATTTVSSPGILPLGWAGDDYIAAFTQGFQRSSFLASHSLATSLTSRPLVSTSK
ncbi:hypothetical protein N8979_00700, partial [bacterium]|nr:hypothetical protein [bacterium]